MKKRTIKNRQQGKFSGLYIHLEFLTLLILSIFFAAYAMGCGKKEPDQKQLSVSGKTSQNDLNIIECKGTIKAEQHFTRYLQKEEKIASFTVKDGSEVKKGDRLVILSNYSVLKEYAQLSFRKLQYADKKNNLKIYDLEISKTNREISNLKKELEEEKKISRSIKDYPIEIQSQRLNKKIDGLNEELKILGVKRDFLKNSIVEEGKIISFLDSQLTQGNSRLKGMEIRAPFDGTVVYVAASGESLHPGDLVIEVLDNKKLYVKALVWQHQLQYIELGSEVRIFPDFFGEYFFKGKVRKISSSHIQDTRNEYPKFSVYIDIEPNQKQIKVGMSVTVKIKRSGR